MSINQYSLVPFTPDLHPPNAIKRGVKDYIMSPWGAFINS